jgi:hypothetical protein
MRTIAGKIIQACSMCRRIHIKTGSGQEEWIDKEQFKKRGNISDCRFVYRYCPKCYRHISAEAKVA